MLGQIEYDRMRWEEKVLINAARRRSFRLNLIDTKEVYNDMAGNEDLVSEISLFNAASATSEVYT